MRKGKGYPRRGLRRICFNAGVTVILAVAMTEGQKARDGLLDSAEGHPGAVGDQALYDALKVSIATLKNIFKAYQSEFCHDRGRCHSRGYGITALADPLAAERLGRLVSSTMAVILE